MGRPPRLRSRLVIFDPGGLWERWCVAAQATVFGPRCDVEVLQQGPLPAADLRWVLVPAKSLDKSQYRWLREAPPGACLFAASLSREELTVAGRGNPGYVDLISEIEREFRHPLVTLPVESEDRLLEDLLEAVGERAVLEASRKQSARFLRSLADRLETAPLAKAKAVSRDEAFRGYGALARSLRLTADARRMLEILERTAERQVSDRQRIAGLETEWSKLAQGSREECARRSRGAQFHGGLAEELIVGIDRALADLSGELERWQGEAFDALADWNELAEWKRVAAQALLTPQVCLPVVGVFSSGKTTLFNYLLGVTPQGHPLLRTSAVHNTALLCRFHHLEGGKNRVELSYRPRVQIDLIKPRRPSNLAVCANSTGVVRDVLRQALGHVALLIESRTGHREWVFVESSRLLSGIRLGVSVAAGQALSAGIRPQDYDEVFFKRRDDLQVVASVRAGRALLAFLEEGRLSDVSWAVRWRVSTLRGFKVEEAVVSGRGSPMEAAQQQKWLKNFLTYPDWEGAGPEQAFVRIPSEKRRFPIELRLDARVEPRGLFTKHQLETDADWDWFQGPVAVDGASENRARGFAESTEAAYLTEQADLHLDGPLFQVVTLIDTPGLNSITEDHERITEEVIHQGQAFLLLCRLDRGSYEDATGRALNAMLASFAEQGVPREEWSQRIFFVLNWFRNERLARNEVAARALVEDFRVLFARTLGTPKVKTYVVNLAPAAFSRARPETLLEQPSLATLIDDLRSFLAQQGLAPRFQSLALSLRRTWSNKISALERRRSDHALEGQEDLLASIAALSVQLAKRGPLRTELRKKAWNAFEGLTEPVDYLDRCLGDLDKKDDFERLQNDGAQQMEEYNTQRSYISKDLVEEINSTLAVRIGDLLDEIPIVRGVKKKVEKLPTFAQGSFRSALGKVAREWPSGWSRFWKAFDNFEYHRTTERNKLRASYLSSERKKKITEGVEAGRNKLTGQVHQACDQALEKLNRRRKRIESSVADAADKLAGIEAALDRIHLIEDRYQSMIRLLERSDRWALGSRRKEG